MLFNLAEEGEASCGVAFEGPAAGAIFSAWKGKFGAVAQLRARAKVQTHAIHGGEDYDEEDKREYQEDNEVPGGQVFDHEYAL